jgi:hypothetical protein
MGFPIIPLQYQNFFGNKQLLLEKMGELTTDLYGLSTCTSAWSCPTDKPNLIPAMFIPHPYFPFVNMERRRITIAEGRFNIIGEFAGIDGFSTVPIYELCLGLGEEPIETHPNFVQFAGTPDAPINGAIFVDFETGQFSTDPSRAIFDKFTIINPSTNQLNQFAGISTYFAPNQMVWRQRYYARDRPSDISRVGHVMTPEGPFPYIGGGYGQNWLYQGVTYEQRGVCFSVSREWRASGWRGWDYTIYG